jgi:dTDP-4-dehydrorhamnose 3,5-epimerase
VMFSGVHFNKSSTHLDKRGSFRKSFTNNSQNQIEIFELVEIFYSVSKPGVFRGMHLQTKSSASMRCVTIISGRVQDVLLDLRKESKTYLEKIVFDWSDNDEVSSIVIPPGVAHGFLALEESTLVYASNNSYDPNLDTGVNPFSLDLPFLAENLEISERDRSLPDISRWISSEFSV